MCNIVNQLRGKNELCDVIESINKKMRAKQINC